MPKESVSLQRFISYIAMQFTSIMQRLGRFIVNPEIKNKIYQVMLNKPSLTPREIAKEVGVSQSTVSRLIHSLTKGNDYQICCHGGSNYMIILSTCKNK